jgi:hypothetical protein
MGTVPLEKIKKFVEAAGGEFHMQITLANGETLTI